jgi:hypothetical protein
VRQRAKKVYRTECKANVPPLPGAFRGCAAASCAPAAPRGSASCLSVRPRPVFRAVERCLPPAPSWARRWALACSCTATPCASCRCCAVRARTRNQRAANGPCAPTLSALHASAADPWEHVVAAGLGGMVGSYVVAWEVRAQRSAVGHPASPLHDPHLNTHAPFAAGARHQRGCGPGSQARQALRGCARLPRPAPPLLCSRFPRSAARGHCARLSGGCARACCAASVRRRHAAEAHQPELFCRRAGAEVRCAAGRSPVVSGGVRRTTQERSVFTRTHTHNGSCTSSADS